MIGVAQEIDKNLVNKGFGKPRLGQFLGNDIQAVIIVEGQFANDFIHDHIDICRVVAGFNVAYLGEVQKIIKECDGPLTLAFDFT